MRTNLKFAGVVLLASGVTAAADGAGGMKDHAAAAVRPNWDIAFGAYTASDYIFRGITQSAHWPSVSAYSEWRYNPVKDLQLYAGSATESIDYPNRAAAEVDFYGGIRPTFDKLALDFGYWYYWYPGGVSFPGTGGPETCTNGHIKPLLFCNTLEADLSFWEVYAKPAYTVSDVLTVAANVFYTPSWLNYDVAGTYASGTAKLTVPATYLPNDIGLPKDIGAYLSGEFGHQFFSGSAKAFYNFETLPEYNTWNAGLALTYKVFTLDLRYYDTDLSKENCNTLTSDHTEATGRSDWCGATFVAKASFDLTAQTNLK